MDTLPLRGAETPPAQAPPGVPYHYDNDTISMEHQIPKPNPVFDLLRQNVPGWEFRKKHAYFLGMIGANRVRFLQEACLFLMENANE
jgi:hypothetical protein